jgi:hypothetical protein
MRRYGRGWSDAAILLLALVLSGAAAPVETQASAPAVVANAQIDSAQAQLRELLAQLDEVEELHDPRDSRSLMNRHWQAVQDYLRRLQGLVPAAAEGRRALGPYGSAGSCKLAASMDPDRYIPAMRDVLWDLRENLANIHQQNPAERSRSLDALTRRIYQRLRVIRGIGWMYGSVAPVAPNPAVADSASEEAYLVRRYCGQCHAPPPPELHSANEWHAVASKMQGHMSVAGSDDPQLIVRPTQRETALILSYLEANGCEPVE